MFKTYKDKKKMELIGKKPPKYEEIRNDVLVQEKNPIKIDDFNEAEENKIKQRVEKRKLKRREVAGNKLLKKKKQEKNKERD